MYRLVESVKVLNKQFYNLDYHQERVDRSRKNYLRLTDELDLQKNIYVPNGLSEGIYKCRIVYSEVVHKIEFVPYEQRIVSSLQIVQADEIDYLYKYENRDALNKLLSNSKADDVIIIKNGFVTDASSSNLVFGDGTKYFTPSTPLLAGTKRAKLLNENIIIEEELKVGELKKFKCVCLINAMLDLDETNSISIKNIY